MVPAADGAFNEISSNVKVYGAIYSAESCSYDPDRGVIVVPNRGVVQSVQANNAWVSFINHDRLGAHCPIDRCAECRRTIVIDAGARAERTVRQRHRKRDAVLWQTVMGERRRVSRA